MYGQIDTKNDNQVMLIRGKSHYFSLKAHFEYVDLASEFQYLVIELLKELRELSIDKLVEVFGITPAIAKNVFSRLLYHKFVTENDEIYSLTQKGKNVKHHEIIVETDSTDLDCEICLTSNSYLGLIYDISKEPLNLISNKLFNFNKLVNKPEHLVKIDRDQIYVGKEFETSIYRSLKQGWRVISESGNTKDIMSNNDNLVYFDELYQELSNFTNWISKSKTQYEDPRVEIQFEDNVKIRVGSILDLRKIALLQNDGEYIIFLELNKDTNIKFGHRFHLEGIDFGSMGILLIDKLLNVTPKFWFLENTSILKKIEEFWIDCGGNKNNTPNKEKLIEIAYNNNEFRLINQIRIRGDFVD